MAETKSSYDIIIVGAGPAGLVASLSLCHRGIKHLIIEGSTFPRDKSCADIITSKAIRSLNRTDATLIPEWVQSGTLNPIHGTRLHLEQKALDIPYKELEKGSASPSCYAISRKTMDDTLWTRISEHTCAEQLSGCHVQQVESISGGKILVLKNGQILQTKLLILATGSQSGLITKSSEDSDRHYALGIRGYFKNVNLSDWSTCELFLYKNLMPGGFYIAPLKDGVCNVNMVIRKDKVIRDHINLNETFRSLISSKEELRERFKDAEQLGELKGSGLMLGTKDRPLSDDHLILAGDAAGLIDLLSANGIPQAMISGELAAERAMHCIEANDFSASALSAYDRHLKKRISSDLSLGRFLSPMLNYSWFNTLVYNSFKRLSGGNKLQRVIYSEHPVRDLFLPSRSGTVS